MALKAVFTLETVEQVEVLVEFARTMELKMELGSDAGPRAKRSQETVWLGEPSRLLPKHKTIHKRAVKIIEKHGGSMKRGELVEELAKVTRRPARFAGSAVKSWLSRGVLRETAP